MSGNRTRGVCVTGRNVTNYTIPDDTVRPAQTRFTSGATPRKGLKDPSPQKGSKSTPCGIQTRNLQIRSLTRYSIAPTGRRLP